MKSAAATLERARFARSIGDAGACLHIADATTRQAEFEHDYETLYWAAEVPGRMYMGRGEYALAAVHYRDALDRLLRHGPTGRLAGAYHDLALAEREAGNRALFRQHATRAHTLYRRTNPDDPCLTGLYADVASDDWEREPANPDRAVAAFAAWREVPPRMRTPHYRLTAAAQQMATAAAVPDLRGRYQAAAHALDLFLSQMLDGESVALILAYAATASLGMHDFERAAALADIAERTAIGRDEAIPAAWAGEIRGAAVAGKERVRN